MTNAAELGSVKPTGLGVARAEAHRAVQLGTRAARVNLPPAPDDSHSNLSWRHGDRALFAQSLPSRGGAVEIGLRIEDLSLIAKAPDGEYRFLLDGKTEAAATDWLDALLADNGLNPSAAIALPYDLPPDVAGVNRFAAAAHERELLCLAAWYDFAAGLLDDFAKRNAGINPGPSPVRCWPHHFDIATYVSLEIGDAESARGVGVGMSPGDESYDQPYFYVNPWPHLSPAELPPAPEPGHWHTEGFVGLIATGDEILAAGDADAAMTKFLDDALSIAVKELGA